MKNLCTCEANKNLINNIHSYSHVDVRGTEFDFWCYAYLCETSKGGIMREFILSQTWAIPVQLLDRIWHTQVNTECSSYTFGQN